MPNVFKRPFYDKFSGSVKIPDVPQILPQPEKELDENEENDIEEAMFARFEPVMPTRQELAERCEEELVEIRQEAALKAYTDASNAKRGELQRCMNLVDETLMEMQQSQQEFMEKYAAELKFLAIDIAETLILTKLDEDELIIRDLVMQTVSRIRNADWLDVQISDKLSNLVNILKSEFQKPEYHGRIQVSPKSVPMDSLRVDSPMGVTDATLSLQTNRLREVYREDGE